MTSAKKNASERFDISPMHKFYFDKGQLLQNIARVYYTSEPEEVETDRSYPYFEVDSYLVFIEQVQFILSNKVFVRLKLLAGDHIGWCTVFECSRTKDWNWMIPMKQSMAITDTFNSQFKVANDS